MRSLSSSLRDSIVCNNKERIFLDLVSKRIVEEDFLQPLTEQDAFAGSTPLELAAQYQHWPLLRWMLSKLDKKHSQAQFVFSKILLIAAFYHQDDVVIMLISMGADVNQVMIANGQFSGYRPLHFAVFHQSESLVIKLMEEGANPMDAMGDALSALDFCISLARQGEMKYWQYVPLLTPKHFLTPAYEEVLLMAAIYHQQAVVKHLLTVGADPNVSVVKAGEFAGYSALHFAYQHNDTMLAYNLLAAGADPDLTADDGSTFRSLVGDYDSHLLVFLSLHREERMKAIESYIKEFAENISDQALQAPSLSEMFLFAISAVRSSIFSLFNGGRSSSDIEIFERKNIQQQLEIKENAEHIKVQDSRINSLEQTVKMIRSPAKNSVFQRRSCDVIHASYDKGFSK